MSKEKILEDIQSLIQDITKCEVVLVKARAMNNPIGVANAQHRMESLMVASHQELSFLYDYIKEGGKDEDTD